MSKGLNESLRNARDFITSQNGTVAPLPFSEEELNPDLQDDLSLHAKPLESTRNCYSVGYVFPKDSEQSEFQFFEDGRQRTIQIGFIPTSLGKHQLIIPVHYFVVAAVILCRNGKELKLWQEPEIRKGILIQRSLIPNQRILSNFEDQGLEVVDTAAKGGDYYGLKKRALQEAKKQRLALEERLITRWRRSSDAVGRFLVVDGTLMNLRNEESLRQCVGVSKSFGSRYFALSEHNRIMRMMEFERSWTFRFHSPEDEKDDEYRGSRERISWYLRLRVRPNTDPEFGLIRVEISKHYAADASAMANRFSHSLLSERLPTSYPAPRWHNHLYPICACENYLSSVMPSLGTINSSMKG